jgi:type II secretion system (T2SS) protein G
MISRRRPDPAKVFLRAALLFCGVALTWTCAAFGLFASQVVFGGHGCPSRVKMALLGIREIDTAIARYQIDQSRCPRTLGDLVAGQYVSAKGLVDPWGGPFQFNCTDDDAHVVSAGPDGTFGTADDVTNER